MLIRRLARPLLASTFIANGVETLMHPQSRVEEASNLVQKGQDTLPSNIAGSLPSDPDTLVKVTAAVQIAGGTLLALGKVPRPAALALAATVVPATVTEQNFWAETDPARKAAKRTAFLKDVSLLGGLMIAASDTAGKPSLGWRGRRAAKRARSSVSGALPIGGSERSATADAARRQLAAAAERGQDLAGTAASKGAELTDTVRTRGPGWAEAAKHRGSEWADVAKHRGTELAETAQARGPEWAEAAKHRAAELADYTKHRGSELADYTKHRGGELAGTAQARGPEWTEAAKHRAAELADYTKHRGSELADYTKQRGGELGAAAKDQRAQLAKAYRDKAR
ncbi:DoxX family protein [Nocardia sp. NPDC024068]|uniref:DoxX family protein n=1 Tax=Nocardia sp. NPDC024068 TaxID=3157197 RepID=UPI0033C7862C